MPRFSNPAARRGLTLIELVVVIAILAVLAAMIVPRLDFLKTQAEHAQGAGTTGDLTTMIGTYRASAGQYPAFDSLIDSSGALITATGGTQAISFVGDTVPLTPTNIVDSAGTRWYASFMEGGLKYVYPHTIPSSNVTNSVTAADVANKIDIPDAVTDTGATLAVLNGSGIYAAGLIPLAFPGMTVADYTAGLDTQKLVAVGIGANTDLGKILNQIPIENSGGDSPTTTYCRYYAIFAVYASGKPAQLKMVVDHRFKPVQTKVNQFNSTGAGAQ